jgi:hypothetical protein
VKPEFAREREDESKENEKYAFAPQINVAESLYMPAVEYAAKDIYGAGKRKYEQI